MFHGQLFECLNLPLGGFGVCLLLHFTCGDDVYLVEQGEEERDPLAAGIVHPVCHRIRDDIHPS